MRSQRKSIFTLKKQNLILWAAMLGSLALTTVVIEVSFKPGEAGIPNNIAYPNSRERKPLPYENDAKCRRGGVAPPAYQEMLNILRHRQAGTANWQPLAVLVYSSSIAAFCVSTAWKYSGGNLARRS